MEILSNDFSIIDIRLIQSLWENKPPEYIAMILDRPLKEVVGKMKEMSTVQKVKLYKRPGFDRKIVKQNKEKDWAKKQTEKKEIKIKNHDAAGLISVRLDHKTVVQVKPGTDIEALKKELNKNRIIKW